jgi:hypothetical protein
MEGMLCWQHHDPVASGGHLQSQNSTSRSHLPLATTDKHLRNKRGTAETFSSNLNQILCVSQAIHMLKLR